MFSWLRDAMSTPMLDEIERLGEAEHALNEQGIFPPAVPNRMQCAPNVNDMLNAFGDGVELGQYMTEGVDHLRENTTTLDQLIDTGWGSLFSVVSQLWTDTKNIQKCMDEQDEVYQKETAEYVEQVKEVAFEPKPAPILHDPRRVDPKPAPIPHDPRRLDPNLSHYEVLGMRQRENTKRYTKGLPQFALDSPIWDGYNWLTSCTNGNYSPFAGSHDGKNSLLDGGLMPDASGATIDPSHCGSDSVGNGSGGGGGGGGGGGLMNIDINCYDSGGHWESNSDGTSSCKM
jgi:hypothetical protein